MCESLFLIGRSLCAVLERLGLAAYAGFMEKLSKGLRPISDEQNANAAVALLLKPKNEGFTVLFVKRVENLADPWSGQMAFPGASVMQGMLI